MRTRIRALLRKTFVIPAVQRAVFRWGPRYWALNPILRKRIVSQQNYSRLPGAKVEICTETEKFRVRRLPDPPTFGHRLAGRKHVLPPRRVITLDRAWMVGRHAALVTPEGRMLMSAFSNSPDILGLEPHDDIIEFLRGSNCEQSAAPVADNVVSLVGRLDPNYFHWIVETCGGLHGIIDRPEILTQTRFLIRKDGARFQRESLSLLGIRESQIIQHADDSPPIMMTNVKVPTIPGALDAVSPRTIGWLRNAFLKGAGASVTSTGERTRIYIHRKTGCWRSATNGDEVADALSGIGFRVFDPAAHPLSEQIRIFAGAGIIAGLHGAGLTNAIFAPNARILELFGSYGDGHMYTIAEGLGMPYSFLRCKPNGDDVTVDIPALLREIDRLEAIPNNQNRMGNPMPHLEPVA